MMRSSTQSPDSLEGKVGAVTRTGRQAGIRGDLPAGRSHAFAIVSCRVSKGARERGSEHGPITQAEAG